MKTKFYKMMFAFVASLALIVSTASATVVNFQLTTGSFGNEVDFSVTNDATGAVVLQGTGYNTYSWNTTYDHYVTLDSAACYTITMLDDWGDGWNGGNMTVIDSSSGVTLLFSTGPSVPWSFHTESLCTPFAFGCTDANALNYDPLAAYDDGSCTFAPPPSTATLVNFQLNTGFFASEVDFNVTNNSTGAVVLQGTGYFSYSNYSTYNHYVALDSGVCYTITMLDSWGDGWNGGNMTVIDTSTGVTVLVSNGAVPSFNWSFHQEILCTPFTYGCTDSIAVNYDPLAGFDDGSCTYVPGCTDPTATNYDALATLDDASCVYACIAADSTESFEVLQGPDGLGRWINDPAAGHPWLRGDLGTPSGSTGPTSAAAGQYYAHVESSISTVGTTPPTSIITSCVDLSSWTLPGMSWQYHMYGAGMGTLDVDVSTDGGLTWTNEWSLSGDQGNIWLPAFVDLSAYSGVIDIRFSMLMGSTTTAPTYQGDAAIDEVVFSELTLGCTDPFADNYDPLALVDDGTCLYTGCLDSYASNFCATCNVSDPTLCTFYACGTLDYSENIESEDLALMGYTTLSSSYSGAGLSFSNSADALVDTSSLQFTGGDQFVPFLTSLTAFNDPQYVSSASFCMDLSTSGSEVDMVFSAELSQYYTNSTFFRVLVNGVAQTEEVSQISVFDVPTKLGGFVSSNANANNYGKYMYSLDAFAGQSNVYVTFEAVTKYNENYSTFIDASNYVWIDDIEVYNVTPCTYYELSELFAFDVTCNGGSDGNAMVLALNSNSTSGDIYTWLTSTGSVYATTQQVTNLAAGSYTVTATDPDNGCAQTLQITIGEPSAVGVSSSAVMNTATLTDSVGSIDITTTGGSCLTPTNLSAPLGGTNGGSGNIFNVINVSSADVTVMGMRQGPASFSGNNGAPLGAEWWYSVGDYMSSTNWVSLGSSNVTLTAGAATGTFMFPSPVVIPAGDTMAFHSMYSTSVAYTNGTGTPGQSILAQDNFLALTEGHGTFTFGSLSFSPRNFNGDVIYGTQTAANYTFAWSNGATTEDISGLPVGSYTVNITDCNGCTGSETYFVAAQADPGCTDPAASNYDPTANLDDGSCTYPGCIDSLALNYDPTANLSDSSCVYSCVYQGYAGELLIDMHDSFGDGWNGNLLYIVSSNGDTINPGGSTVNFGLEEDESLCIMPGCYMVTVGGGIWQGEVSWELVLDGDTLLTGGAPFSGLLEVGAGGCSLGCTDSTAQNFDPLASTDNGTCLYNCTESIYTLNMFDNGGGWAQSVLTMYDASGDTVVSNSLTNPFSNASALCLADGCYNIVVTTGANNAGVSWNLTDSLGNLVLFGGAPYGDTLCLPAVPGCTDSTACNFDPLATTNNGSCDFSCVGCTDSLSLNWSGPSFTIDDGSCVYCQLTTSALVTDATANGAANGAIDLSVSGSYAAGTFCEDFESYNTGDPIAESSPNWNSWGELLTGASAPFADDAPVSNLYANTGSNSLAFNANSAIAGPEDVILPLSNTGYPTPYVNGLFTLTHNLYVTTGAYFNFQAENTPGITWALEVFFDDLGGVNFGGLLSATYPTNQWFEQKIVIDLTNNNWEVFHDGVSQGSFSNLIPKIAAIDYFPTAGSEFYVDDICLDYFAPFSGGGQANPNGAFTFNWSNGATTEDISNLNPGVYIVTVTDLLGCTVNDTFTVLANPIPGCTDPTAINYNPLANVDDGSCIYIINGCTDSLAVNFDPGANTDDGSCVTCSGTIVAPWFEDFSGYAPATTNFSGNGWYNDTLNDNLDWTVDNFGTPSGGTGPSDDFGGGGNYIYTEASFGNSNKTAILASLCVNTTALSSPSIQFAYHMFGSGMGDLNLVVNGNVLWTLAGDQGDQWFQAQVLLPSDSALVVQFVGNTGPNFWSDIALDNIRVDEEIPAGCTDPLASNYDPLATFDDGSCLAYVVGCTDSLATNYNASATTDPFNECCFDEALYIEMYDSFGDGWNGNTLVITDLQGVPVFTGTITSGNFADANVCLPFGCYNVTVGGGIWQGEVSWNITNVGTGQVVLTGPQFSAIGTFQLEVGAGGCTIGCTDSTALNFDPIAAFDDGSCVYACTETSVYTTLVTDFNQSECSFTITDDLGYVWYTSPSLSGGAGSTTVLDSTCLPDGCYFLTLDDAGNDGWVTGNIGSVTLSDNSGALASGSIFFGSTVSYSFSVGVCQAIVYGCTDSLVSNYDPLANTDDGSCCVDGCTDPTAFNYDTLATCDDGSCTPFVYGCTDPVGINYYPGANTDDGSCIYLGCTDPIASNYNPLATIDDNSCTYFACSGPTPTGLAVNWTTDTKAEITWDNMNSSTCLVDKYFVRYRVDNLDGTYGPWVTKSGGAGNGLCVFGLNTTIKRLQFLTSSTTYQVKIKGFYCGGSESNYSAPVSFVTGDDCPPMTNLTVSTFNSNQSKARFQWDTTGVYEFARIALRVDTVGAAWQTAGGFGVNYPTFQVNKFGLQSGESYRAQGRTFCDPSVTSYRSTWSNLVFWTQPGTLPIRGEGGTIINNLDVYPNPSRDIFNVTFVAEDIQDLEVRVINVVGEVVYTEALEQFVGEYTKQIDLTDNSKGVYFLEITTNSGVVNKKLIIQ